MSEPEALDDPTALARRLNDNRNRVLAGEEIPPEEYAEIIAALRQNRMSAATATRSPRAKAVPLDLEAL